MLVSFLHHFVVYNYCILGQEGEGSEEMSVEKKRSLSKRKIRRDVSVDSDEKENGSTTKKQPKGKWAPP